jgi:hypothetical protein
VFESFEESLKAACEDHYLTFEHLNGAIASIRYESKTTEVDLADPQGLEQSAWELRGKIAGVSTAIRQGLGHAQSFSEVAGAIFPRVVSKHWCDGFHAVSDEPLMTVSLGPSLAVVFALEELFRPSMLGEKNVEQWGVTQDRVTSAARSNLYARTMQPPTRQDLPVAHDRFELGDSYDSGRTFILGDLLWREAQEGIVIGIPSDSLLMIGRADFGTEEMRIGFLSVLQEAYHSARTPVSPHALYYHQGQAVSVAFQRT